MCLRKAKMRDTIFSVAHMDVYIKQTFIGKYGQIFHAFIIEKIIAWVLYSFRYLNEIFGRNKISLLLIILSENGHHILTK